MSFLFEQSPDKIQQTGKALRIPQTFRDPFEFGLDINGRRSLGFTQTGPTSGNVDVAGAEGFQNSINNAQAGNTAATGRVGGLINRLQSNENPFIQARVRPFENLARENTAAVSRDVGRRGIQGSLGQNQISNARFEGGREVADQTSLATQEALGTQLAAEAERRGLGSEQLNIAQTQLQGELQNISAGMDALQTSLGNQKQTSAQLTGSSVQTPGQDIGGILEILKELGIV
jgi:hypothetical protein